jgi:hypothetical protein
MSIQLKKDESSTLLLNTLKEEVKPIIPLENQTPTKMLSPKEQKIQKFIDDYVVSTAEKPKGFFKKFNRSIFYQNLSSEEIEYVYDLSRKSKNAKKLIAKILKETNKLKWQHLCDIKYVVCLEEFVHKPEQKPLTITIGNRTHTVFTDKEAKKIKNIVFYYLGDLLSTNFSKSDLYEYEESSNLVKEFIQKVNKANLNLRQRDMSFVRYIASFEDSLKEEKKRNLNFDKLIKEVGDTIY